MALMLAAGRRRVTAVVAAILGLLLARYRDIFFAMLSLAFSMILYGLLVKTSGAGLHRRLQRLRQDRSSAASPTTRCGATRCFGIDGGRDAAVRVLLNRYLRSHRGRLAEAIRDNETARRVHGRIGTRHGPPATTSSRPCWPGSAAR